jgi:hypothetical protein
MKTLSVNNQSSFINTSSVKNKPFSLVSLFGTTWSELEFNYYSIIVFTLTVSSCIGGAAAAFILSTNAPTWQLAICAGVSMFNNSTAIGHAPVKWVIGSFITSMVLNILLIAINL